MSSISIFKKDLIDVISTEKYYQETELVRLVEKAKESPYHDRVEKINKLLGDIAISNTKLQLINQYFQPKNEEIKKDEK